MSNGEEVAKMVSKIGKVTPLPHTRLLYIMPAEMVSYRSATTLLDGVKMKIFLLLIIILTRMRQMSTIRMIPPLWSLSQSNHILTMYLTASLIWPGKYLIVIAYLNKFTTRTRLLFLPFHHFADSLKVKAILLDTYTKNTEVVHNLSLYFMSTSSCDKLYWLYSQRLYILNTNYFSFFIMAALVQDTILFRLDSCKSSPLISLSLAFFQSICNTSVKGIFFLWTVFGVGPFFFYCNCSWMGQR